MRIVHRKDFDQAIKSFGKCEVEITVRKKRRTVSNPLRRYYFGVIVKMVMLGLKEMGTRITFAEADAWVADLIQAANAETVHAFLKDRFVEAVTIDEDTCEIIKNDTSTKRMTNTEFMEFYSPVYQWAAEFLGIIIPEPDPEYNMPKNYIDEEKQKLL